MAGVLFIVNVPKKEYENHLRENTNSNLIVEKEKVEKVSKVIDELKEKQLECKNIDMCKSTNNLYQHRDVNSETCKFNSESIPVDGFSNNRKVVVWDEIKQALKPNKNKLKISRPVRSVDVLAAFRQDTPLETILQEIVSRLDIKNAAWNSTRGDKFWQVTFSIESGNLSEELLQVLRTFGIGSRHQSSVSLLPCALYYKSDDRIPTTTEIEDAVPDSESNTAWSRFSTSVRARTNLAQVLHDVRANGTLTFDWVFMLLVAAFVAAIGLIENSTVILVASMLISPLMGPITTGTLGTAVRDRSLQLMGVKNEFLGLFLVLVVGFLAGLIICGLDELYGVVEEWPTGEMLGRCAHRSLWIGILVAIPSGAGCALAVLGDYTASLVGVAISASLLPPAVNAGLLWSMALTRLVVKSEKQHWLVHQPSELALLGTASLCLTLVNIVCIFLAGVAVYKVKEVSPLERRDISWWRANKDRFNATIKQNKEESLNWDAYTQWCTNSLERKEKQNATEKEKDSNRPSPLHSQTVTFRKETALIRRLRAHNMETYCHRLQLEDNYIPLNSQMNADLQMQIESHAKNGKLQNTDEENPMKSIEEPAANNVYSGYYNFAYHNDHSKTSSEAPTLEPSLNVTVDKSNYVISNNKTFDV
ncbi:unnamed protein product [Arctia plantaginis]|uniref:Uncharacterized protein n=1 Tax=Arctia plantaginis TaxID=874455 RepID=A0A8S0YMC0_ARCPL|nr:unnamed protein product [Arctia plantaginis]